MKNKSLGLMISLVLAHTGEDNHGYHYGMPGNMMNGGMILGGIFLHFDFSCLDLVDILVN